MPYFFWQHSFTSVTVSAETCDERNERRRWYCRLTIVGADRERLVVARRGRGKTVCARDADRASVGGRSTSPLEDATRSANATEATRAKSQGKDPPFETEGA